MNALVGMVPCTLSDDELVKKIDALTDEMFVTGEIPDRHIPARPDGDYDLLIGALLLRFVAKGEERPDVTDFWNKALSEYDNVYERQAYWRALRDLEAAGIVRIAAE